MNLGFVERLLHYCHVLIPHLKCKNTWLNRVNKVENHKKGKKNPIIYVALSVPKHLNAITNQILSDMTKR